MSSAWHSPHKKVPPVPYSKDENAVGSSMVASISTSLCISLTHSSTLFFMKCSVSRTGPRTAPKCFSSPVFLFTSMSFFGVSESTAILVHKILSFSSLPAYATCLTHFLMAMILQFKETNSIHCHCDRIPFYYFASASLPITYKWIGRLRIQAVKLYGKAGALSLCYGA